MTNEQLACYERLFHAVFARVQGLLDGVSASPAP